MATPSRLPDFDMSSVRRPDGLDASRASAAASVGGQRDSEQRFAKMVAEAEYKLLEEKSRAHEREARLKEELAQEKSRVPQLVTDRVESVLRERSQADASRAANGPGGAVDGASAVEVQQLRQQLTETQRLLSDAERRYQQQQCHQRQ